eukprot:1158623-Pelagomonas_calceolata.AAC.15
MYAQVRAIAHIHYSQNLKKGVQKQVAAWNVQCNSTHTEEHTHTHAPLPEHTCAHLQESLPVSLLRVPLLGSLSALATHSCCLIHIHVQVPQLPHTLWQALVTPLLALLLRADVGLPFPPKWHFHQNNICHTRLTISHAPIRRVSMPTRSSPHSPRTWTCAPFDKTLIFKHPCTFSRLTNLQVPKTDASVTSYQRMPGTCVLPPSIITITTIVTARLAHVCYTQYHRHYRQRMLGMCTIPPSLVTSSSHDLHCITFTCVTPPGSVTHL